LFATVIVAVVALWVLARIRFPERETPVNPVAPVLTQLAPTPAFTDLAAAVSDVQSRALLPFVALHLEPADIAAPAGAPREAVAALRVRDDVAVALLDSSPGATAGGVPVEAAVLNLDPATGLAAIKVPPLRRVEPTYWSPSRLGSPRYMLATMATRDGLSLRPVFVSTLGTAESVPWGTDVWTAPPRTDLTPGTFAFTSTGALAGLVVRHDNRPAILPLAALMTAADRLIELRQGKPGWIGLTVQPLTPALATATGATGGMIVTWVDPKGPAAGSIQVADVIETIDGAAADLTEQQWTARTARLVAGESLTIRVRRGTMTQPARLTAAERPPPAPTLGLTMRRARTGVEVLRVEPGSAAARAGIRPGDIITFAAGVQAPTPTQINRAFAAASDRALVLGVTRSDSHVVVAVYTR
jgi:hypothetical protein